MDWADEDAAVPSGNSSGLLSTIGSELQAIDRVSGTEKRFSEEGRTPQSAGKVQPMPPPRHSVPDDEEYARLANRKVNNDTWRALQLPPTKGTTFCSIDTGLPSGSFSVHGMSS